MLENAWIQGKAASDRVANEDLLDEVTTELNDGESHSGKELGQRHTRHRKGQVKNM